MTFTLHGPAQQFSCGAGVVLVAAWNLLGNHTMQYCKVVTHVTAGGEKISFLGGLFCLLGWAHPAVYPRDGVGACGAGSKTSGLGCLPASCRPRY